VIHNSLKTKRRGFDPGSSPSAKTTHADASLRPAIALLKPRKSAIFGERLLTSSGRHRAEGPGRGAAGKVKVAGAVESGRDTVKGRRLGRLRLAVVDDVSASSLEGFLDHAVARPTCFPGRRIDAISIARRAESVFYWTIEHPGAARPMGDGVP
jgi:hypothetical protein